MLKSLSETLRIAMNRRHQPIYRLDGIEIDTSRACLKRDGQEQHLRPKTFHVLLYLLEQRQRLVTKNDLIENFWAETAVTDNSLEQCLAEIRKVLGDDSRHPRFIKTVPRAGYRFIGEVEEVAPEPTLAEEMRRQTGTSDPAEKSLNDVPPAETALTSPKPSRWIAHRSIVIWLVVILIAAVAFTFYSIRKRSS